MFKDFWARLMQRRRDAENERADREQGMSPAERKFVHESVEDHTADAETGAHLGGIDPNRLLGE